MARSRRRTPITNILNTAKEKQDKWWANRNHRAVKSITLRAMEQRLRCTANLDLLLTVEFDGGL